MDRFEMNRRVPDAISGHPQNEVLLKIATSVAKNSTGSHDSHKGPKSQTVTSVGLGSASYTDGSCQPRSQVWGQSAGLT